ncbi:MAG: hydantoinase B/oxoprolinase family protein, partial [Gemmatimonadales bacterium]
DALADVQVRTDAPTLDRAIDQTLAASERAFRRVLSAWPAGTYRGDSDAVADPRGGGDRAVRVTLTVGAEGLAIDLAGTSPQAVGCLNLPPAGALAAALGPLLALAGPGPAADEGFLRAVRLEAPAGTLVNPTFPAATGLGPAVAGALVAQAVGRALDQCLPGQAPLPPGPVPFVRLLRHADNAVRASGRTPVAGLPFATFYTGTSWLELLGPAAPALPSAEQAEQEWGVRVWEWGPRLVLEALDSGAVLSAAGPDGRTMELAEWERGARLELTTEGW